MQVPACTIPPVLMGLITEERELVVLENVRGPQLLALVYALKASNDAQAKVAA
jgi:hypothetical protein